MPILPKNGLFEMPELPFAHDALAPAISAQTVEIHYGRHTRTYLDNLNALLPGSKYEGRPLEDIVTEATEAPFLNNAGQLLNHTLYFAALRPAREDNAPTGALLSAIERDFGTFVEFRAAFEKAGATLFGSGWVWLSADDAGRLHITQEPNAANPLQRGLRPLLTFDVWEHAYYLDYQNRRPAHLAALWPLVDWDVVAARFAESVTA
ncbi:MAG: superoxide dismutase [Bacteroidaceae bacterium]|nr:superoxide dismutase [Bacteroidaceae bacterium]